MSHPTTPGGEAALWRDAARTAERHLLRVAERQRAAATRLRGAAGNCEMLIDEGRRPQLILAGAIVVMREVAEVLEAPAVTE
ncbi:MAG TPA: hypothetical protein VFR11_18300 [Micromonosporaceae bacterium]|jgi:hypothetical protein|nr:hypothetical protein [Micromonosporaceae bacterium]